MQLHQRGEIPVLGRFAAGRPLALARMGGPPFHGTRAAVLALALLGAVVAAAPAAEPARSVYQPVGAPADPRVPAQWNRYHDHAQATELLQALAKAHPNLCRLQSLGKSYGGRDMWVLTVTNHQRGKETEKSGFWIDGCIHANEIQATEVVLYTAWYLAESYGRSPLVTRLLDERVFYLLPILSPDSRDAHMYQPNTTHSPRTGQRPVDDDRDGLVDEDKPDDLDGDGHITQMRIRDPNGRHKPHPDFPELMIPCRPDEKGEYTLLDSEGFDNDGDGRVDEDGEGFYDPNRNWGWGWQPPYVQHGAHDYPLSILENRLVADFIAARPNIAGAQSFHNAGGMILRGPQSKDQQWPAADTRVYVEIGRKGEQMLPNYKSMNGAHELYEVFGGELDWMFVMHGIFAFTNELFTSGNYFREKTDGAGYFGKPEVHRQFDKYLLFGDGIVPWHEVQHPQFGKVEVGGPKKNWLRQPPSFLLEEECHRNMAFTLYHADQMPRLQIDEVKVVPLAGGLTQVTATLSNSRLIPTHSQLDVQHKVTPPDQVTLAGPAAKVVAGLISQSVVFDAPREQKRRPHELRVPTIAGMEAVYVRWLVEGAGPYTITARSVKGGVATRTVEK